MKLDFHEYANLFPTIVRLSEKGQPVFVEENEEWRDFVADIRINGQQEPIVLYEGKILDGRNRYLACLELGLKPKTREYKGEDPLAYALSANLHRRHLTESQRAMVAADVVESMADPPQDLGVDPEIKRRWGVKTASVVKRFNVSPETVRQARAIREEDPEEAEKIRRGESTVTGATLRKKKEEAEREAKRRAKEAEAGRIKAQQESINPPLESAVKYLNMATEHLEAGARLAGKYGWTYLDQSVRDKLALSLDRLESAVENLPWGEEDESE